jgi:acetyltransferase-like isoleucine patch superfamily enzyme
MPPRDPGASPSGLASIGVTLSAVLVADTRASAVQAAVQTLIPAVARAEAAGIGVDVIVVDNSGRPDVAEVLRAVGGARVLRTADADRSAALSLALSEVTGDMLWLGGSDGCPAPTAIAAMAQATGPDGGLVVAEPDDPAPHVAGPVELLRGLWAEPPSGVDPVPELLRRARGAGACISSVAGAGVFRQRIRRPIQGGSGTIGPATYAGPSTTIRTFSPLDQIELGAYCSIADEVRIVLPGGRLYDEDGAELQLSLRGTHREQTATTFPIGILVPDEPYDEPPPDATGERLVIGDDVWIGHGAAVIGAVTVGTGSIIGARALVREDVPPYSVVGGVPARVLRKRFEDDVAARLLRVAWWNWPEVVVQGAHRWFTRPVQEFLDHFDPGSLLPAQSSLSKGTAA